MDKVRHSGASVVFWCPGCQEPHRITTAPGGWTWNASLDAPTISPSVRVTGYPTALCHSFVTGGCIQFLQDSTHRLAGQTVPLPEWTYDDQT